MTYRLYFVLSRWLFKEHNKDTLRKYLPYGETNINSFMTEAPIISKALVSRVNLWTGLETHSELCDFLPLTISTKNSVLDVWQGSDYAFVKN